MAPISTYLCTYLSPAAIAWDAAFAATADPSGRAIADVHEHCAPAGRGTAPGAAH